MYPRNVLGRLLLRIDILDVIRHYFGDKLKRRGNSPTEWIMLCPFHRESTPSFTVTTRKRFYHCFGCGAHGDAIHLVMEWEGLDFHEAMTRIISITGFRVASGQTTPSRARRRSRTTRRQRDARLRKEAQDRREYRNQQAAWKKRDEECQKQGPLRLMRRADNVFF